MPFWQTRRRRKGNADGSFPSSSSPSTLGYNNPYYQSRQDPPRLTSTFPRSLLPHRRRLRLDPPNKLYFPYEPGKQVRSAVSIKNICKSPVAFKFQTTAPKSCYMRPPGGILAPGESLIATSN